MRGYPVNLRKDGKFILVTFPDVPEAITQGNNRPHALEMANDSEYGLTGAVYTKNHEKIRKAREQFFVGNLYINRKCTGAMVGAHPFGGFNMSGTDSKAGGPDYLLQFLQAKSIAEKIS